MGSSFLPTYFRRALLGVSRMIPDNSFDLCQFSSHEQPPQRTQQERASRDCLPAAKSRAGAQATSTESESESAEYAFSLRSNR